MRTDLWKTATNGLAGAILTLWLGATSAWASGASILHGTPPAGGPIPDAGGVRVEPDRRGTTGTTYDASTPQPFRFGGESKDSALGTVYPLPQPHVHPTLPVPSVPVTPVTPLVPQSGGANPQSHPGGSHWRGTGR